MSILNVFRNFSTKFVVVIGHIAAEVFDVSKHKVV
jgi:hypothetical protein